LGKQLGGGSFFKKFNDFPNGEGEFKLKIVEFVENNNEDENDDR